MLFNKLSTNKQLLTIFSLLVLVKTIFISKISTIMIYSDAYIYAKLARCFYYSHTFCIHSIENFNTYPPLYPILLSPSYIFQNMNLVYFFMKFTNVIASTLIIIPAYLIAKEFLNEKKAILIALIIGLLPSTFSFPYYLMSENIFYTLFLFFIYFYYKASLQNNTKYILLSAILLSVNILSRTLAIILFLTIALNSIYYLTKKDLIQLKTNIKIAILSILFISPWYILLHFKNLNYLTHYSQNITLTNESTFLVSLLTWLILYSLLIIINSNFIFLAPIIQKFGDKKLFKLNLTIFNIIIPLLLAVSNHSAKSGLKLENQSLLFWLAGRPLGRYIDFIVILIILVGLIIFLSKNTKISKRYILALIIASPIYTNLIYFKLYPLNNISSAWIGSLKYLFDFLIFKKTETLSIFSVGSYIAFIILFAALLIATYLLANKKLLTLLKIFLLFLILSNILLFVLTYSNAKSWENNNYQLGQFYNSNVQNPIQKTVLFDERCCNITNYKIDFSGICVPNKSTTSAGFWINSNIIIGSVNETADYIISLDKNLNYNKVFETDSGIILYEN